MNGNEYIFVSGRIPRELQKERNKYIDCYKDELNYSKLLTDALGVAIKKVKEAEGWHKTQKKGGYS